MSPSKIPLKSFFRVFFLLVSDNDCKSTCKREWNGLEEINRRKSGQLSL